MEAINEHILRIEEKIQQLLKQYLLSQKENQLLKKQNDQLSTQLQTAVERAGKLQQKLDALLINSGSAEGDSKKELEKRINSYLKDIDKCLAMMNG